MTGLWGRLPLIGLAVAGFAGAAHADFDVCNHSTERASVAIGYNHEEYGWTSEGWWRVPIGECVTIINGSLKSRYYYIYATGHKGGVWQGKKGQDGGFFCVSKEKFTLHNREYSRGDEINCSRQNLKTQKFTVVDTGDTSDFTFNLRD